MKELKLKYGCNPNQKPASISMEDGRELPVEVLQGNPGYINFLDALNAWQLVRELREATGKPAAASFKHVSPAGAALGGPLTDVERAMYFVPDSLEVTPMASAYIRARGTDRLSSFGDWVALSDECDEATAKYLKAEVSDGIIAPSYSEAALRVLHKKKGGKYNVVQIDPTYEPAPLEHKEVLGVTFTQLRNDQKITADSLKDVVTENRDIPEEAKIDMIVASIVLKYTQSNSVCYVKNGQAIGVGAGQQSRIHCTRLAGDKADKWFLRQSPQVLSLPFVDGIRRADRDNAIDLYTSDEGQQLLEEGAWKETYREKPQPFDAKARKEWIAKQTDLTLGSDAFFPFGDNVERAFQSGVKYIVQPGGSIRDDHVIATCDAHGIAMAFTGIRLFHH